MSENEIPDESWCDAIEILETHLRDGATIEFEDTIGEQAASCVVLYTEQGEAIARSETLVDLILHL